MIMINIQDSTIILQLKLIIEKFEEPALLHEKETILMSDLFFYELYILCKKPIWPIQYGLLG